MPDDVANPQPEAGDEARPFHREEPGDGRRPPRFLHLSRSRRQRRQRRPDARPADQGQEGHDRSRPAGTTMSAKTSSSMC